MFGCIQITFLGGFRCTQFSGGASEVVALVVGVGVVLVVGGGVGAVLVMEHGSLTTWQSELQLTMKHRPAPLVSWSMTESRMR